MHCVGRMQQVRVSFPELVADVPSTMHRICSSLRLRGVDEETVSSSKSNPRKTTMHPAALLNSHRLHEPAPHDAPLPWRLLGWPLLAANPWFPGWKRRLRPPSGGRLTLMVGPSACGKSDLLQQMAEADPV